MEQLLTSAELAKALRLKPTTIRRMTREGRIPFVAVGTAKRYQLTDVLAALAEPKTEEPKQ